MANRNTEHMRARLAEVLAGRSSREVGRAKDLAGLVWIYRWGWSTPTIVDMVASPSRRGVAARLVKRGLAQRHPTPTGSGAKGVPVDVIVLTPDGVAEVEAERDPLPYPTQPDRCVPWHQLRHDTLVQLWTARRLVANKIAGYTAPREIADRSQGGIKQPDAVWHSSHGQIAVELELTAKKDRELHQAALAMAKAVHPGTEGHPKGPYNIVAILSHSEAILAKYRRLLQPGATITKYKRDAARHWHPDGQIKVPDWITGRVILEKVQLW